LLAAALQQPLPPSGRALARGRRDDKKSCAKNTTWNSTTGRWLATIAALAFLFAIVVISASPSTPLTAPAGLRCLTTWYAGSVEHRDGGWGFSVDGGAFLPWRFEPSQRPPSDAGADDLEEMTVDLESIYRVPYVPGPIVALDVSDAGSIEDPGRARVEQLFLATYGQNRREVFEHLAKVRFFGLRYPFHELAADPLRRVVIRLEKALESNPSLKPFLINIGGTFIWRKIARSQNLSTHAFGIAIDLNVDRAHYWRWQRRGEPLRWRNKIPQEIVDAFEAEGFIWGGRWLHFDTMHFEYRPELLSATCREETDAGL
jgi:hypothetical protein